MRRIREIMGTPVLNQKTGAQMGHVKDLIIDDQANRLIGIILETDSLFSGGSPGILRQDLVQINDDFIVADCSGSPELRGNSWLEKSGGTVYNCDGTVKGCIVDVFWMKAGRKSLAMSSPTGYLPIYLMADKRF